MNGQNSYCTEDFFPHFRIQYHNIHNYTNMCRYHFHEEYEIYFLISGQRYYFIEDRSYLVKQGDLVIVKNNVMHRTSKISNPHHYERACFYFKKSFTDSLSENIHSLQLFSRFNQNFLIMHMDESQQEFLKTLVYKINNECLNEPEFYAAYIEVLLTELLIFINRCIPDHTHLQSQHTNPKDKKIYDIINYISKHYMDDISLPFISREFFISVSGLTKAFKQVTGFSFTEYLNNIRIKNAHNLLDNSQLTVSEIAHKVGYNSITHFGRVFKESTGYTPSQYRNTNRFLLD